MGRVPLIRRNLLAEPRRLALGIAGIGLALMLILLLGGLWAGIQAQSVRYVDATGAALWVLPADTRTLFTEGAQLPTDTLETIRAYPGVEWAAPALGQYAILDLHDTKAAAVLVGSEPGQPGGAWALSQGRAPSRADEVAIDRVLADEHGLALGDRITVADRSYRVAGITRYAGFMTDRCSRPTARSRACYAPPVRPTRSWSVRRSRRWSALDWRPAAWPCWTPQSCGAGTAELDPAAVRGCHHRWLARAGGGGGAGDGAARRDRPRSPPSPDGPRYRLPRCMTVPTPIASASSGVPRGRWAPPWGSFGGGVPLARRNLFQDRRRVLLSTGGVAVALLLVLGGIFAGAMRQLTRYIDRSGADLIISQQGVRTMHMSASVLRPDIADRSREVPGVAWAEPIRFSTGMVSSTAGRMVTYVIGYDPTAQHGGPGRLVAGRSPLSGEAVLDRQAADQLQVREGDSVRSGLDSRASRPETACRPARSSRSRSASWSPT